MDRPQAFPRKAPTQILPYSLPYLSFLSLSLSSFLSFPSSPFSLSSSPSSVAHQFAPMAICATCDARCHVPLQSILLLLPDILPLPPIYVLPSCPV